MKNLFGNSLNCHKRFLPGISNDRDEKSAKVITGIIRLTDCRAVPNDDGPQRGQIRAWPDRKKRFSNLDSRYVIWKVEFYAAIPDVITIDNTAILGGCFHAADRLVNSTWWDRIKDACADGCKISTFFKRDKPIVVLLQLTTYSLSKIAEVEQLVTPLQYALRHNIVVQSAVGPAVVEAAESESDAPGSAGDGGDPGPEQPAEAAIAAAGEFAAEGPDDGRYHWTRAGASTDYDLRTPAFMLECVRLAWFLQSTRSLEEVCQCAARVIAPDMDTIRFPFPSFTVLRQCVIKLDLLRSLSRRHFYCPGDPKYRTARSLSPDSSPQRHKDYFAIVEEIMRRRMPIVVTIEDDPFGGFEWQRRSLMTQCFGRRHSTTASKVNRFVDSIIFENSVGHMGAYRDGVKNFLRGQGSTERNIPRSPFGSQDEIQTTLSALRRGDLHLHQPKARELTLLWNAFDQPGVWHILYNPLKNKLKALPEWKKFEQQLKALVKVHCDESYKKLLLETMYKDALRNERHTIHRCYGSSTVDLDKWENVEDHLVFIIDVAPIFCKYYIAKTGAQSETGRDRARQGLSLARGGARQGETGRDMV